MDRDPPPRDVPGEIRDVMEANLDILRMAWDRMFPENPVSSRKDSDGEDEQ